MKPILSIGETKGPKIIAERLKTLRPDPEGEVKMAKRVMEKIIEELKSYSPYNSAEIKMVGSLMKNTMITERKEFDVVISLPSNLKSSYPPTIDTRDELQRQIAYFYKVKEPKGNQQNVIIEKDGWKVDILPTFVISIDDFLKKTEDEKQVYKPHMSLLHVEFIRRRGQKFQEFCRLAKYWTNGPEYTNNRLVLASSWFIELIAAIVFDFPNQNWNLVELFECFLRRVKNMRNNRSYIAFSDFFKKEQYKNKWTGKLAVIDPTDPEDNLADRGPQIENMDEIIIRAKKTLKIWKEKNFNEVFQTYFSK